METMANKDRATIGQNERFPLSDMAESLILLNNVGCIACKIMIYQSK